MRDRREPWKWPSVIGLAVSLTLMAVFLLPRQWLNFLLPARPTAAVVAANSPSRWLILLPPPAVEILEPESESPPRASPPTDLLHEDPRWWREGWTVAPIRDEALFAPSVPAIDDTLSLLLGELGLGTDFMTAARPDSILAARLFLLHLEDSFRYDELKPYWTSVARARAYADINSRAADMYDEHLQQEIQVPD